MRDQESAGLPVHGFSNIALKWIATLGVIGYIPGAPGTYATVIGLLILTILRPTTLTHVLLSLVLFVGGIVASHRAERILDAKDSRHIVIDELCGCLCSLLFIPLSAPSFLAAFFLFRLFDILKPFPIRLLESSLRGGFGIMADDLLAALYTNCVLRILFLAHPGFFSSLS